MIEHASLRKISFYDALRRTELKQLLEKDEIVSSCLNNDFSLLLVNVSYVAPRLNLYNVENLQLLKSF
jgi:beta-xylosidase